MKRFRKDPFTLMTFHRVLIGSTIMLCIFYAILTLVRSDGDGLRGVLPALIALVIAAGGTWYLMRIRGK